MSQVRYFDPAERQREKERARALDAVQLRDGIVSPVGLRQRNSFFASLDIESSAVACQDVFA